MKKIINILIVVFNFFIYFSCTKASDPVNQLTQFDINYTSNLTIPASSFTLNVPVDITTPIINTQSSSKFSAEKTTKDLVDEIKLTKFYISSNGINLNFLKSFSIYIKTPGQADILVATKTIIPAGSSVIDADVTLTNIKQHIFSDEIQFRVAINFNSAPPSTTELKMDEIIHVNATLIK